jgi:hypothetical protein
MTGGKIQAVEVIDAATDERAAQQAERVLRESGSVINQMPGDRSARHIGSW